METKSTQGGYVLSSLLIILGVFTLIAAWVTHIVVSIKTASWILLAIGAFVFPVGVIHGIGCWFGAF